MNDRDVIDALLSETNTWLVVGCSPDATRDSHRIAALLQASGNTIVPITPQATEILGERCYPSLSVLPGELAKGAVVDIFRRSDAAGAHIDEAIETGAAAVWMQLDVTDRAAAARAEAAGLDVIMDRCPAIELQRLGPTG
jgi:predicted CoA-binding protein